MFKNTTFHEWDFCKIFISFLNTLVLMAALLVSGKQTHPRKLRAETQINKEVCPTNGSSKERFSMPQVKWEVGLKHNWEVMDGWRQ